MLVIWEKYLNVKKFIDFQINGYFNKKKAFIFKRGKVFPLIKDVVQDMREVMYPYTAIKLQESDKVKIKDYMKAASSYEISHFFIFTSTEKSFFQLQCKISFIFYFR